MTVKTRKKLIEVALPLEAINVASAREKSIRHGHPSTLHLWWARRPLAAARAVIFAQVVDDPSSWPERFPSQEAQDIERQRLFRIIEQLVMWENSTSEELLETARTEMRRSWSDTCEDNKDHPRARELFDPAVLPGFHDPFCGGGALPLEAQRLGLEAWASDLNPIAVLITKAMIEIPARFAEERAANPRGQVEETLVSHQLSGSQRLADDVRYYAEWVRDEANQRIGHLYPKVTVTPEMVRERPDLTGYAGRELTVIAWLWARTVRSPNPALSDLHVPLVSTFMLSTKSGKEVYVEPIVEGASYRFTIRIGTPPDLEQARNGTRLGRGANFACIVSGAPISASYVRAEAQAGRMRSRLMAVVAEGDRGRVYVAASAEHEARSAEAAPHWKPDLLVPTPCHDVDRLPMYGMPTWGDAFTPRQLLALTTFSDLVLEARERVRRDAVAAGIPDDGTRLVDGGSGADAYADAVSTYLGFLVDQQSNQSSMFCGWNNINQQMIVTFSRQAISMVWDYAECNVLSKSTGSYWNLMERQVKGIASLNAADIPGKALQRDARTQQLSSNKVVATDPPYFDNIGYADLSDFFYVWLRRSVGTIFPDLFSTLAVPKNEELVAMPHRHANKRDAETFFLNGMTEAMHRLAENAHPVFPVTIFYAFKQSESENSAVASTGWETFLEAVIEAGFAVTGTWPIKTESANKLKARSSVLASSIVLVCRARDVAAPIATRRELLQALKAELPEALRRLQHGNIAPVDLAQSAIGPGMAVYSRYSKVLEADGSPLSVRDALALINQTLDEVLAEQEGEFDADTRWAVAWFDQHGFAEGDFGVAETLTKAKNTSVAGMVEAGIVKAGRGKVRLLRPEELASEWDPVRDERLTVWEAAHHLVKELDDGEQTAADLARKLGGVADAARDLAYRLYVLCERKRRAPEAVVYNALVQSWPEIQRLAAETTTAPVQERLEI